MDAQRLLVVEDDPALRSLLSEALRRDGFLVTAAPDGAAALAALAEEEFDVVVLDLRLPDVDGIRILHHLRAEGHEAEVVILTGHADTATAIEALKLHAFDYVTKPVSLDELRPIVARAGRFRRLRLENRSLRRAVTQAESEGLLLGGSRAMQQLRDVLERASRSDSNVLILGESGSGKELAARAIHRGSRRRELPFLALNCAALPDDLLESELFGHERGAFTGATARRYGLLELAHRGTLFLDEIGEMSAAMQAKLLRALDRGEVRRLGGDRVRHVDVRVIAATNKDLARAVAQGQFRHDLYYRLGVVVIEVPPLRQRTEDIPLLVEHFAQQVAPPGRAPLRLAPAALALLARYPWPGNVRELRNLVERLSVLSDGEVTAGEVALHLPAGPTAGEDTGLLALEEVERRHILRVLQHCGGNRTQAARILGVDPKTLYNKLKAYRTAPPLGVA
ncbi:MAG TPA: sigma-54 dependent transcriptional regulator [Calidithermus sp.]|nr:sigma-54 dependent transcriptional regulator [Calidithermus sp.]